MEGNPSTTSQSLGKMDTKNYQSTVKIPWRHGGRRYKKGLRASPTVQRTFTTNTFSQFDAQALQP